MLRAQLLLFSFGCVAHFSVQNAIRQYSFVNCTPPHFLNPNDDPFVAIFVFIVFVVGFVTIFYSGRTGHKVHKPACVPSAKLWLPETGRQRATKYTTHVT